jgi:LAO/AO transport system kinase
VPDVAPLLESALSGDRAALARAISLVERGGDDARAVGRVVHAKGGGAYTVGITGPPGAGKSTLTDRLITEARASGDQVGVLAVDPTSPFSGGAILGDRVRMQDHAVDDGVFIRSMATRGHLGGLSLATPEVVRVLDAAGFEWVLVETVGVGQVEVEIAGAADTTVVVLNPGAGDGVQAMKAGLLEVADLLVINKADRPGVHELERDLKAMLELDADGGTRPVLRVVATAGDGVPELWQAIVAHRAELERSGALADRRAARVVAELREIVTRRIEARVLDACGSDIGRLRDEVVARRLDPWTAADEVIEAVGLS